MFYKFVGGDDAAISDVLDKVLAGSIKFSSTLGFNDPFEFKFSSVAPTRVAFDDWHARYDPGRSSDELEAAWRSFSGPAADWNTVQTPRRNLLDSMFVLCLAPHWDSHLMWAHYTSAHRGFVVEYHPELIFELSCNPDFVGEGRVSYQANPPELRWFQASREEMLGPVLFSKMADWAYEREYRVVMSGNPAEALYLTVDPTLVSGIILGPRAPATLRARALAAQATRAGLTLRKISTAGGYALTLEDVVPNVVSATHIL